MKLASLFQNERKEKNFVNKFRNLSLCSLVLLCFNTIAQKTIVEGRVYEGITKTPLSDTKVWFYNTKTATYTDSTGFFHLETYYPVDSIQFFFLGYDLVRKKIKPDEFQELNIHLKRVSREFKEITVLPPDEFPSTKLHKRIIAHKPANNKEKLDAYEYEAYNKIQVSLSNLGDEFSKIGPVKHSPLILSYLDSSQIKKNLPVVLTESVSDFYFTNHPKRKKEVIKASRITGVKNLQASQFLGDTYLELNIYDNVIDLFGKSFVSPLANNARNVYKFYLDDSMYIDNKFCYKLRFEPKKSGDLTFVGEMWVNDTTYAVKSLKAKLSPSANLNYIQDFQIEQNFEPIENEVWMLAKEKMFFDIKLAENTKMYGLFANRTCSRKNYKINQKRPDDFYKSNSEVQVIENQQNLNDSTWGALRHDSLNKTESGIIEMIDTLERTKNFQRSRKLVYFATTGYYPHGYFEFGNINSLVSSNPVENIRLSLALRTSLKFSKRLEIGGKIGYGFLDDKWKYNALLRYNITPKKRGVLSAFYYYDLEQMGQSPTAAQLGNTFATFLNTAPFNKLTFVKKVGLNFEKDFGKDFILFTGFDCKEFTPLGISSYLHFNPNTQFLDTVNKLRTTEFTTRFRWSKNESFLSGYIDRTPVTSSFPILSIQAIFGIKGVLGSMYNYQKIEFQMEHYTHFGRHTRVHYGFSCGYIFGQTAYPFLKVHEGNQSYWLSLSAFNKLNFLELISDKYVSAFMENHWGGLFLNQIPGIKKLKWRMVTTQRILYGALSPKHNELILVPSYVKSFGSIPYAELSVGIENILNIIRVDFVWRVTHNTPDVSPFGIRARFSFNL